MTSPSDDRRSQQPTPQSRRPSRARGQSQTEGQAQGQPRGQAQGNSKGQAQSQPQSRLPLRLMVRIGLLAAAYAIVTVALAPISYGPVQVRISEALTLLPFFWGPWAAVGLWLGCMIANAFGGLGILDVIFGCLLTLGAGLLSARAHSLAVATLPPILLNAFGVAAILVAVAQVPYGVTVAYVGLGQVVAVVGVGVPLVTLLQRRGWLRRGEFAVTPADTLAAAAAKPVGNAKTTGDSDTAAQPTDQDSSQEEDIHGN